MTLPTEEYVTNFYNRTLDAINRYQPDLLYFDMTVAPFYPFSDAGLKIAAHHYNSNMARNGGQNNAVMFCKILDEEQRKALVWDVERGAPNEIVPDPWQTCTCIGGWHYDDRYYENGWYKSAATVVKLLADVVSKNGNLLLSVPLRADGTLDDKEEVILNDLADWMEANKECIFDTRPWVKFGEGPIADADIQINAQGFNEGSYAKAGHDEIRFTQTPEYLYAIALGWPEDGRIVVKSLASGSKDFAKKIKSVELLGHGKIRFRQTPEGLVAEMPEETVNGIAPVLRIKK